MKEENWIKELEGIRMRLTKIYMELGNPSDCDADSVLSGDINRFRKKFKVDG